MSSPTCPSPRVAPPFEAFSRLAGEMTSVWFCGYSQLNTVLGILFCLQSFTLLFILSIFGILFMWLFSASFLSIHLSPCICVTVMVYLGGCVSFWWCDCLCRCIIEQSLFVCFINIYMLPTLTVCFSWTLSYVCGLVFQKLTRSKQTDRFTNTLIISVVHLKTQKVDISPFLYRELNASENYRASFILLNIT